MIITISGPPGSGKDTIAEQISQKLKLPIISMGNLRREAAKNKGMTIEEFNEWSKDNPEEGDYYFDNYQKKYGKNNNNFIMVSRLGWYFIPHSVKIYIDVKLEEGAKRIFKQKKNSNKRNESSVSSIKEQVKLNKDRMNCDINRYSKLYGINPYTEKNYDIIIDSTELTIEEVVKKTLNQIKNIKLL